MTANTTLTLKPLAGDLARVEKALETAVHHEDRFLREVAGHLSGAGGKRVRPTLTLSAAYCAQGARECSDEIITGAVACELVHLGSLHHDDVIDEAQTRRSVPSVNARWSNIVAILSGDYLLARASSLAASLGADVAALLADTIGELCRGQILELQHLFDVNRSEEDYARAIEGKTASLFATSCRVGGMVSQVDAATLDSLTQFGHHLGMCFQVVDDILDLTATDEALGKPSGQDMAEGIYTLPVIYAMNENPLLREKLGGPLAGDRLKEARQLAATPDALATTRSIAWDHATKAREALAGANNLDSEVTGGLSIFVEQLIDRAN
ncbi:MAG: polyprenyl synthetase family protein [Acidimicrobiia bacterium]|nr:polyprenyl synthetase family protein [Acidimicrobiia bacterium]